MAGLMGSREMKQKYIYLNSHKKIKMIRDYKVVLLSKYDSTLPLLLFVSKGHTSKTYKKYVSE